MRLVEMLFFFIEKHAFAMTIVANKYIDYLWQLKHASLCHPGLIDVNAPDWTIAFSKVRMVKNVNCI